MNRLGSVPGGVDAVVVDIGLPDRRGDVLVREIRAVYPLLPIVLATGQDAHDLQRKFQGEARMTFVAKPYTAAELLQALAAFRLVVAAQHGR